MNNFRNSIGGLKKEAHKRKKQSTGTNKLSYYLDEVAQEAGFKNYRNAKNQSRSGTSLGLQITSAVNKFSNHKALKKLYPAEIEVAAAFKKLGNSPKVYKKLKALEALLDIKKPSELKENSREYMSVMDGVVRKGINGEFTNSNYYFSNKIQLSEKEKIVILGSWKEKGFEL